MNNIEIDKERMTALFLDLARQGRKLFEGTVHDNEFHEEDYDMTPLLSAFAEL